jgi:hypothetical protein
MVSQKNRGIVDGTRGCGGQSAVLCVRWRGRWQAGPININFSLNFEISTNFEIHNAGLPDV